MATFSKRASGWWQAKVRKDDVVKSKTFPTKGEAEIWASEVEREIRLGDYADQVATGKVTLKDLAEKYIDEILPGLRGKHQGTAARLIIKRFGKTTLAGLKSPAIATWRDDRLTAGLSASTVRKEVNTLSRIVDIARQEWGYTLKTNPCSNVARPAEDNARERRLEPGEAGVLIAEAEEHVGFLIVAALETGARLGELLALRWRDVDLDRRQALIRGIEHDGKVRKTKNKDVFRAVPLSRTALSLLAEIRDQDLAGLDVAEDKKPSALAGMRVFGWWAASDSFNKTWTRVCDRSGVHDLRFHDLRHEATSRLFERTRLSEMKIAAITGHKSLSMLKRYTHLRTETLLADLDAGR